MPVQLRVESNRGVDLHEHSVIVVVASESRCTRIGVHPDRLRLKGVTLWKYPSGDIPHGGKDGVANLTAVEWPSQCAAVTCDEFQELPVDDMAVGHFAALLEPITI